MTSSDQKHLKHLYYFQGGVTQNETAHGQEMSQSCNLCEGPVCPSRIRLGCLELHLDQSLGTRITVSDGQTGSDTDSSNERTHTAFNMHIPHQVKCINIKLFNKVINLRERFRTPEIVF